MCITADVVGLKLLVLVGILLAFATRKEATGWLHFVLVQISAFECGYGDAIKGAACLTAPYLLHDSSIIFGTDWKEIVVGFGRLVGVVCEATGAGCESALLR